MNSSLEIEIVEEGKLQIKSKKSKFILSALDAKTFPLMDIDTMKIVLIFQ
jgi:DNA polymerase III sliding clamp (beta) subunit (PCNA family)